MVFLKKKIVSILALVQILADVIQKAQANSIVSNTITEPHTQRTLVETGNSEEYTLFLNIYYACFWQRRALQSDCSDCKKLQ